MNTQTVTAVAVLLAELLAAGVQMSTILKEVAETGRVPPERWAQILKDIDRAETLWRNS